MMKVIFACTISPACTSTGHGHRVHEDRIGICPKFSVGQVFSRSRPIVNAVAPGTEKKPP
jgi:hypothetical protein